MLGCNVFSFHTSKTKIISPKTCIGIALVYLVSLMHEQSMKSPTVQDVFWPTPGLACIVIIFSPSTGHPSFPIPTRYTNCLLLLWVQRREVSRDGLLWTSIHYKGWYDSFLVKGQLYCCPSIGYFKVVCPAHLQIIRVLCPDPFRKKSSDKCMMVKDCIILSVELYCE